MWEHDSTIKDLDQRYRALRRSLRHDENSVVLLPPVVKNSHDLGHAISQIVEKSSSTDDRRNVVREEFLPLLDSLDSREVPFLETEDGEVLTDEAGVPLSLAWADGEGKSWNASLGGLDAAGARDVSFARQAAPNVHGMHSRLQAAEAAEAADARPLEGIASSAWTGRTSRAEQARIVRSLAPTALEAITQLIQAHEHRLHNHPPEAVATSERDALDQLKTLQAELGELIRLVEQSQPLEDAVDAVRNRWAALFGWTKDTAELFVDGLKPIAASSPVVLGAYGALSAICNPATLAAWAPGLLTLTGGYFAIHHEGKKKK